MGYLKKQVKVSGALAVVSWSSWTANDEVQEKEKRAILCSYLKEVNGGARKFQTCVNTVAAAAEFCSLDSVEIHTRNG